MPEGPEVRRHADAIGRILVGEPLRRVEARTKAARAWLDTHGAALVGRRVTAVTSHGKHLVGTLEAMPAGGDAPMPDVSPSDPDRSPSDPDRSPSDRSPSDPFGGQAPYFHSHLMMWGRWHVFDAAAGEVAPGPDRRDRARLVTDRGTALLRSAPVFTLGLGDPYASEPLLATLGPDALPVEGPAAFDAAEVRRRMAAQADREVGAVLLDQQAVAGLGNYLRAEVLFLCRLSPFRRVASLDEAEWTCLLAAIPEVTARAYRTGGVTLSPGDAARIASDAALVYTPGAAWQHRHYVFRRTNLPCLACGTPVRQARQVTREAIAVAGDVEAAAAAPEAARTERIVYFCPACQGVDVPPPRPRR